MPLEPTTNQESTQQPSQNSTEQIAEEFHRILELNLLEIDETQVNAFVDLGESMGLARDHALELVAEIVNAHMEEMEMALAESNPELFEGLHSELPTTDEIIEAAPEATPEVKPIAEHAPLPTVSLPKRKPPTAPPQPVAAPAQEPLSFIPLASATPAAPAAKAAPTPPISPRAKAPSTPRFVRLGRTPIFERGSQSAEEERLRNPDFSHPCGMEMRYIPSGSFLLGSDDPSSPKNEKPSALVTLSGFYMSRFPVTNGWYEQFDSSHKTKRLAMAGEDHPVVFVSSADAIRFCDWLGRKDPKHRYRLPTEAEWEYAARGTSARVYPWGNETGISTVANFADASSRLSWRAADLDDGFAESSPVGAFPDGISAMRIEEMAGNVWEWCIDFYDSYRSTPRTNPRGPSSGVNRVIRGGSFKSRFTGLRASARGFSLPTCAAADIGIRVVCEC